MFGLKDMRFPVSLDLIEVFNNTFHDDCQEWCPVHRGDSDHICLTSKVFYNNPSSSNKLKINFRTVNILSLLSAK